MGNETQVLDLMKGIRDDVRGVGEDLAAVKGKVSTLDVRIREIEDKGRKRATLPGAKEQAEHEGGFSFRRLILAIAHKEPKLAQFEVDVCREAAKRRDLSTDGDSLGGY
ncbi:MAG: hypothetical protein HY608_10100, partial [Planctomycetes bacterium]|nr:hypothetical protein [Planctomycetota bacterium]